MKKNLVFLSALLLGACVITSCSDDDSAKPQEPDTPVLKDATSGVYVVCSGNQSSKIDGSLTYFDLSSTPTLVPSAFKAANGRSLGLTANDGVVYGSKLYIVVDAENTVEVVDARTQKSFKQLKTTELLGEKEGFTPRHIVARDGKIYVDTYGGYVAVIDTVNYALVTRYQVGSYPEGMAFIGDTLFVANSNYGMGDASLSAIELTTGKVTEIRHDDINNPTSLAAVGDALYIVDGDVYDPTTWVVTKPGGLRVYQNGVAGIIMNGATAMGANQIAVLGDSLFIVTDAYTDAASLTILNAKTNKSTMLQPQGLGNVNAIGVDPVTKQIWAACYTKDEGSEWANYSAPGICIAYDLNGVKVDKMEFQTGVGPTAIVFNHIKK